MSYNEYDKLSRLTGATYTENNIVTRAYQYAYALNGNRLSASTTVGGTTTTESYFYNLANQITSLHTGDTTRTFTYDPTGNLTNDGINTYTYDVDNNMLSADRDGSSALYTYDGLGNRVRSTINNVATDYLLDVNGSLPNVLGEFNASQPDQNTYYLYGLDMLGQQRGDKWSYYGTDGLGSIRQITDSQGLPQASVSYDPFGTPIDGRGNVGTFGFAGEQTDDNGLMFLRARYYNPQLGSFMSHDPFGGVMSRSGSRNGYNYTEANPVNYSDPSGRCIEPLSFALCVMAGAAFIGGTTAVSYDVFVNQGFGGENLGKRNLSEANWGQAAGRGLLGGAIGLGVGALGLASVAVMGASFTSGAIGGGLYGAYHWAASASGHGSAADAAWARSTNPGNYIGSTALAGGGFAVGFGVLGHLGGIGQYAANTLLYGAALQGVSGAALSIRNNGLNWVNGADLGLNSLFGGISAWGIGTSINGAASELDFAAQAVHNRISALGGNSNRVIHEAIVNALNNAEGIRQEPVVAESGLSQLGSKITEGSINLAEDELALMRWENEGGAIYELPPSDDYQQLSQEYRYQIGMGGTDKANIGILDYDLTDGQSGRKWTMSGGFDQDESRIKILDRNHYDSADYIKLMPPEERIYNYKPHGRVNNRYVDSENKLLTWVTHPDGLNLSYDTRGTMRLYTELPPCPSCGGDANFVGVIQQFREYFPNIALEVYYRNNRLWLGRRPPHFDMDR